MRLTTAFGGQEPEYLLGFVEGAGREGGFAPREKMGLITVSSGMPDGTGSFRPLPKDERFCARRTLFLVLSSSSQTNAAPKTKV
jgi:hypothetical protein